MCSSPPDTGHKTQLPESPLPYSGDVLEVITRCFYYPFDSSSYSYFTVLLISWAEMHFTKKRQRRSPIIKYFSLMKWSTRRSIYAKQIVPNQFNDLRVLLVLRFFFQIVALKLRNICEFGRSFVKQSPWFHKKSATVIL